MHSKGKNVPAVGNLSRAIRPLQISSGITVPVLKRAKERYNTPRSSPPALALGLRTPAPRRSNDAQSAPHEAVLLVVFGSHYCDSANRGLLHRTQHIRWDRRDDFPDCGLGESLRRLRALDRVSILSFCPKLRPTLGHTHFQFGPLHRHESPQKQGRVGSFFPSGSDSKPAPRARIAYRLRHPSPTGTENI